MVFFYNKLLILSIFSFNPTIERTSIEVPAGIIVFATLPAQLDKYPPSSDEEVSVESSFEVDEDVVVDFLDT
jgi:hypothetical protein